MDRMLWSLFSKPLYRGDISVGTPDLSKVKWVPNQENWVSDNMQILNEPEFQSIGAQLFALTHEFFHGIMKVDRGTEIYITESWLNKTEKGQMHHRHWHPNSVLSGVLYIDTDGTTGKTVFINSEYSTFEFNLEEANIYNSKKWGITPRIGDVLLFPSNVEHMVDTYEGDKPRITLSFNTFVKGTINSNPLIRLDI
jgi:uncharacterized protein (TIGR02466 family)